MDKIELDVKVREEKGTGVSRRLRKTGFIPSVIYGGKEKPFSASVNEKEIKKILEKGENVLVYLKTGESESKPAIIKELQFNPVSGKLSHIDFYRISLKDKIEVDVHIETLGESPGIRDGGILEYHFRELRIKCLPTEIPQKIEVDISNLKINDSIHIFDLKVPKGIEVLADKQEVVLTITPPTELKVEEPTAEVPTGPEVIGEKEREERRAASEKEKEEKKKEDAKPEAPKK